MLDHIRSGFHFLLNNDLRTIWREFIKRDSHPLLQFIKYGFCGILAVMVHSTVFGILGHTVFPAFQGMIVDGVEITREQLIRNFIPASICGFLASNTTAYLSNLLFVFKGGRHRRFLEYLYFTGFSSIGYLAGLALALRQLYYSEPKSWQAVATIIVTATLVNFVCRKYVVFKK